MSLWKGRREWGRYYDNLRGREWGRLHKKTAGKRHGWRRGKWTVKWRKIDVREDVKHEEVVDVPTTQVSQSVGGSRRSKNQRMLCTNVKKCMLGVMPPKRRDWMQMAHVTGFITCVKHWHFHPKIKYRKMQHFEEASQLRKQRKTRYLQCI